MLKMSNEINYPKWHFIKVANQGSRNVAPSDELMFEKLPALGAVIRESTQNSLDARDGDVRVHMKISVYTGNQAMPRSIADKYLEGLFNHLSASDKLPNISENTDMSYVVVEDFGTHGLVGDPRVFGTDGPENNRFYWLHRNTNRTQARKNRGGSFGYGKASFALASRLHSFITVSRASDTSIKVFGNSIAKPHKIDGWEYEPYGDFGFEESDPEKGIGIVPSQDESFFEQICSDFNLSRSNKNGLSVIIPFPEKIYTPAEIIESMIRNYFLPICQDKLSVEVSDGIHQIPINSETIGEVTSRMNWSGEVAGAMSKTTRQCMIGMVELANWWSKGQEAVELETLGMNQPVWTRSLIPEEAYGSMRERLEEGQPLAIRASLPITKKTVDGRNERYSKKSDFIILLRKQEAYGGSDAIWIRRYLSVPKTEFIPKKSGFIAIMISADGPLEQLLRESEEVAHTEHRIKRIEKNYKYGGAIIRFFRQSSAQLIEYLQETTDVLDTDWLDSWFPSEEIEQDETKKPNKRRKKRKKKIESGDDDDIVVGPDPPPEDLEGHDSVIQKIPGGFSIFGEIKDEIAVSWRVKLAYVRDDNRDALKSWKSFDFDLSSGLINFELDGVVIEKAVDNTIVFKVDGPIDEYSIDVTGFDNQRDLYVYARPTWARKEVIE